MESQLRRRATNLATTTTDLLYIQVLDNIASTIDNPATLPYFDVPAVGTAQLQRTVQASYTPGWDFITSGTYIGRYLFDKQQAGLNASNTAQEAWQLTPLNNPDRLFLMQSAFRRATRTEDSYSATVLDQYYYQRNQLLYPNGPSPPEIPNPPPNNPTTRRQQAGNVKLMAARRAPGGSGGGPQPLPLAIEYQSFVRPGWFMVGGKKDVPKHACYVGSHCKTYVWVTRDQVDSLSKFTLAILDIAMIFSIDPSTGQVVRQNNPFGALPYPPPAVSGH